MSFTSAVTAVVAAACAGVLALSAHFGWQARVNWRAPADDRDGRGGGKAVVSAVWSAACLFTALSLILALVL